VTLVDHFGTSVRMIAEYKKDQSSLLCIYRLIIEILT